MSNHDLYTQWQDESRNRTTKLEYRAWLDIHEKDYDTKKKVEQIATRGAFGSVPLTKFLPLGTTLSQHLSKYPDCDGHCDDCTYYSCANNTVYESCNGMYYGSP